MADSLKSIFLNRLATGLKHTSITKPSKWAETYRYMPEGKWNFEEFPWLREMHDSKAEYNVGQKAAQMGFTETCLNITFYTIDILARDVLYVLPTKSPGATEFSSGRFDPALELSPYLQNLFTDVNNIGHKRAGSANLYVRGSHSRSDLKSLPITKLFLDEVAEFVEQNIALVLERLSGQKVEDRQAWMISTPTVEGHGISKYYGLSDKAIFAFKCPSCSKHISLKYPESLVICGDGVFDPDYKKSHLICTECKQVLPHEDKKHYLANGVWVPQVKNTDWRGFSISQLYSTRTRPQDIASKFHQAKINPADACELYNSKLGMTFEEEGSRVSDVDIDYAINNGLRNFNSDPPRNGLITMGVDVGKWYHYEIAMWQFLTGNVAGDTNIYAKCFVLKHGKCKDTDELMKVQIQNNILQTVIDMNPEKREALRFARRFPGQVHLVYFSRGVFGKSIQKPKELNPDEPVITVDRTSWLDSALGRFKNQTISLPIDTNLEYREHLKSPVKHYKKDDTGNPVARYITRDSDDDHYAFARLYNEIAMSFVANMVQGHNIT